MGQIAEELHRTLLGAFGLLVERLDAARVEQRDGYVLLVCPPAAGVPAANGVWADTDGDEQAAADLERSMRELADAGLPFWVQTRGDRHPRTESEASRAGLALLEEEPGMVAAREDLREDARSDAEIRSVRDERGLGDALATAAAGFEIDADVLAPFYSGRVAETPGLSTYVGYVDGEPVSTAVGVLVAGNVGIFNVATPPAHRGRGHGAALTARAVADGVAAGARLACLQASEDGLRVYGRMGFRPVERYRLFGRAAG